MSDWDTPAATNGGGADWGAPVTSGSGDAWAPGGNDAGTAADSGHANGDGAEGGGGGGGGGACYNCGETG